MSEMKLIAEPYIEDAPLPDALDFNKLMSAGTGYLKNLTGNVWTNYNDSDPGVTVLEQLCYALTELGYCAGFDMADILTEADGRIPYQQQFFAPEKILCCAPLTIRDYQHLVLDRLSGIRAVYFVPERVAIPSSAGAENTADEADAGAAAQLQSSLCSGRYQVYYLPAAGLPAGVQAGTLQALLNQHRNAGEYFLPPRGLMKKTLALGGAIDLLPNADPLAVNNRIMQVLESYQVPAPVQSGYAALSGAGYAADAIFNGPEMQNGWFQPGQNACEKRDCIRLLELSAMIAQVDGVLLVQRLQFEDLPQQMEVAVGQLEIADLQISSNMQFMQNRKPVRIDQARSGEANLLRHLQARHQLRSIDAKVDLAPALPSGSYRNIEEYYSVQNTFPDIFAIGYNSPQSDAASYRVAVSRQLKGYLLVFDQMLANEFSQLAHLGDLFSFVNLPASQRRYSGPAWPEQRDFAVTYYSQALYTLPDVQPLLRGNGAFRYQFSSDLSERQAARIAWKKFRDFSYNEYAYGLRLAMESEQEATQRRDGFLNHVLARHGENAADDEDLMKACQWYGSDIRTRIVVKSLWLQNYQALSYARSSACYADAATRLLKPEAPAIDAACERLCGHHVTDAAVQANAAAQNAPADKRPWWQRPLFPELNGEIDQEKIDAGMRVHTEDFNDFSGFELAAGILLNIPVFLISVAAKLHAVLNEAAFGKWIEGRPGAGTQLYLPGVSIIIVRSADGDMLYNASSANSAQKQDQLLLIRAVAGTPPLAADYLAHAGQLSWLATQRKGFVLIEHILLRRDSIVLTAEDRDYFLSATMLLPDYVCRLVQEDFGLILDKLMRAHWPAHIQCRRMSASFSYLKALIPVYVDWYNQQGNVPGTVQSRKRNSRVLSRLLQLPRSKEDDDES